MIGTDLDTYEETMEEGRTTEDQDSSRINGSTVLQLHAPLIVKIKHPNGKEAVDIDVFAAARMLTDAEKQPNEQMRWESVKRWLADKLQCPKEDVSENQAWQFHEVIVKLRNEGLERIKNSIR